MGVVLAVIGTILKWIGIILLWILGIVLGILILILVLLAVAIKIKARGEYRKDHIEAEVQVTYLFRLVHVQVFFKENALAWQVKVAGKRVAGSQTPPEQAAAEPEKEPDEAVFTEEEVEEKVTQTEAATEEVIEEKVTEPVKKAVKEILQTESEELPEEEPVEAEKPDGAEAHEEIPAWAKSCLKPIKPISPIGPSKLDQFWEKIGGLIAKVTAIWNEYQAYPNKREIVLALKAFFGRLLHSLRLRDSLVHLRLGLADPSTLGTITGVIAVIGSWCQNRGLHLEFEPEFQEECVEVGGCVEMHIRILALSWIVLRLVLNKYILRLIMYIVKRPKK